MKICTNESFPLYNRQLFLCRHFSQVTLAFLQGNVYESDNITHILKVQVTYILYIESFHHKIFFVHVLKLQKLISHNILIMNKTMTYCHRCFSCKILFNGKLLLQKFPHLWYNVIHRFPFTKIVLRRQQKKQTFSFEP